MGYITESNASLPAQTARESTGVWQLSLGFLSGCAKGYSSFLQTASEDTCEGQALGWRRWHALESERASFYFCFLPTLDPREDAEPPKQGLRNAARDHAHYRPRPAKMIKTGPHFSILKVTIVMMLCAPQPKGIPYNSEDFSNSSAESQHVLPENHVLLGLKVESRLGWRPSTLAFLPVLSGCLVCVSVSGCL